MLTPFISKWLAKLYFEYVFRVHDVSEGMAELVKKHLKNLMGIKICT